jgi:erythromycin esterase
MIFARFRLKEDAMVRRRRFLNEEPPISDELVASLTTHARPLCAAAGLDPLVERIDDARFVLIGEASHGTADFYSWRAALTRRLIEEKEFNFVAVEGDWPDCYQVNRFVKALPDAGASAEEVLKVFDRWPTWMWANVQVADFAEWLREFNEERPAEMRVGFYGLDVYSLWDSLYQVMGYLRRHYPDAVDAARQAFACFEPFGEDVQEYARSTALTPVNCRDEVVRLLRAVRARMPAHDGAHHEAHFVAEQNALVLKNAEEYYRTMVRGGPESWNVRDRHMAETLDRLIKHHGPQSKAIIWEHNTHIGDARFTDMVDDGMVNVGQLARERYAADGVVLVGFGSYHGRVIAGREWEAAPEVMTVPPAREGSWEALLHDAFDGDRLLLFSGDEPAGWRAWRGHRAIGVVYRSEYEQFGNYVPSVLPRRYDAFIYLDRTEALQPLPVPIRAEEEYPETYPSGV